MQQATDYRITAFPIINLGKNLFWVHRGISRRNDRSGWLLDTRRRVSAEVANLLKDLNITQRMK